MRKFWWYSRVLFVILTLSLLLGVSPPTPASHAEGCPPEAGACTWNGSGCDCIDTVDCTGCAVKSGTPGCGVCVSIPEME
jgi:hypothetical protein